VAEGRRGDSGAAGSRCAARLRAHAGQVDPWRVPRAARLSVGDPARRERGGPGPSAERPVERCMFCGKLEFGICVD